MSKQLKLGEDYRSLKKWKYETLEPMECEVDIPHNTYSEYITLSGLGFLHVHPRYAWDGPSGPTFDTKTVMRASLFHDALCQLIREGLLDKKYRQYADDLLRQHIREDVEEVYQELLKASGFKKSISGIYRGWNRFRANYWHLGVRAYSRWKGM